MLMAGKEENVIYCQKKEEAFRLLKRLGKEKYVV